MKVKEIADYFVKTTNINIIIEKNKKLSWEKLYLGKEELKIKYGENKIIGIYPYDDVTITIAIEED